MRYRLPVWLLLLYVALDLGNPLVQGAVSLTSQGQLQWVEAVRQGDAAGPAQGPRQVLPAPPGAVEAIGPSPTSPPVRAPRWRAWLTLVRAGDPPAGDFPPPTPEAH